MSRFETVEIAGQKTCIADVGSGEVVVVLHGWGGRIESMAPVVACLQSRFRVIALDLPGFGRSPAPAGAWGTGDYARWLTALLHARNVERAHFLGHSFGGKVSLYVAAGHPEMVEKLVLVGASGLRSPPSIAARLKRAVSQAARAGGRLGTAGRRVRQAVYARVASADYRDAGALRPTFVKVVNEDVTDLLPSISAPVLLVWGSEDDAVPLGHAQKMERLIPDAGLVVFERAGHFANLDQPERFC
ncbi:MAG: alpha/beta hydrolase, partial [Actinomycetota bacterium]|nr:alpha/beta hydrolase [Actinomycetota bacterium]